MMTQAIRAGLLISLFWGTASLAQAAGIAGLTPSQRPADAPVITEFSKNGQWYAQALTGIEQPYPASLRFLEDQGAWFTPFIHPGMMGHYDLRGWHSAKAAAE